MPRTVANLIYEFLAPEQPDYCRQASLELLAAALKVTGPVVHCGQVVSLGKDGSVDFEPRTADPVPATSTTDPETGEVTETLERPQTDAELAGVWSLPAACETPVPDVPPADAPDRPAEPTTPNA